MTTACDDPRFARLVELFETLAAADVARLGEHCAADVRLNLDSAVDRLPSLAPPHEH